MMTIKGLDLSDMDQAWLLHNNRSRSELVTALHILVRGFDGSLFSLSGEVWLVRQHEYDFRDDYLTEGPRNL